MCQALGIIVAVHFRAKGALPKLARVGLSCLWTGCHHQCMKAETKRNWNWTSNIEIKIDCETQIKHWIWSWDWTLCLLWQCHRLRPRQLVVPEPEGGLVTWVNVYEYSYLYHFRHPRCVRSFCVVSRMPVRFKWSSSAGHTLCRAILKETPPE